MGVKKIVVISPTLSTKMFEYMQKNSSNKSVGSMQHFYNSLLNGLVQNGIDVTCISVLPIINRKLNISNYTEIENGIIYKYIKSINLPFIKSFIDFFKLKRKLKKEDGNNENTVIIFDSSMSESFGCLLYAKRNNIKTIGLTLDLPDIINKTSTKFGIKGNLEKLYFLFSTFMLKLFDSYVFLTEYMNKHVNENNKPYVVIDCIAKKIEKINKDHINDKPIVFYGGVISKEYGLGELITACKYLNNICDVWLYGECDFKNEMELLVEKNENLFYHDVVSQKELHKLEANADILINPRQPEEFTYYSFPSKTVEYMQLRVPVLMFKLPCLSSDYDDLLFYIKDKTPKGIAESIISILNTDKKILEDKTNKAFDYVSSYKNPKLQGKKLINLANNLLERK